MANYEGVARTNYFRVKVEQKFRDWAKKRQCDIAEGRGNQKGTFAIFPNDYHEGSFLDWDPETEEHIDIMDELADHLADGSVAIIMESGHEKLRYISGYAEAINNKKERVLVGLRDIYNKADCLGTEILPCEY